MPMIKRPGTIIKASSIDDLPVKEKKEPKIDFHAIIPLHIYEKLDQASKDTGYMRNELLSIALESFLNNKQP